MKSFTFVMAVVVASLIAKQNSAQAALIGATRIRITQNSNEFLSIAELLALNGGLLNSAASSNGGVASQSSTGFGGVASRANDGNTNGVFGGNSVSHTNVAAAGQFWEVVLGSASDLESVFVFGRSDCCQNRDNNLTLQIFNASNAVIFQQNFGLSPDSGQGTFNVSFIPEPATLSMLALAGLGILGGRRGRAA
ncbi:MAG: PEP-CTERM sorting domain-containing protein [Phycisphaeraceae bacterium]